MVILGGGLLIAFSLATQMGSTRWGVWGSFGVILGAAAALGALLVGARALGGWVANRAGAPRERGHGWGMAAAAALLALAVKLWDGYAGSA